jgi:hypothetical protein
MDIEFCQAIYNNNVNCHYRAKHNGYCGIHISQCTDKTDINFCQGLTKCGKNCRKVVKYGNFCSTHKHSEKPDNFHISLYEPDVEWPDMKHVLYFAKKCNNGKELDKRMKCIDENVNIYYYGGVSDQLTRERKNRVIIAKIELIFRNFFLDYNTDHWQGVIKELQEYIGQYSFLKKYREEFRKNFDQSYRIETQKNYLEKVLTQSDLGSNLAKKIVSSM